MPYKTGPEKTPRFEVEKARVNKLIQGQEQEELRRVRVASYLRKIIYPDQADIEKERESGTYPDKEKERVAKRKELQPVYEDFAIRLDRLFEKGLNSITLIYEPRRKGEDFIVPLSFNNGSHSLNSTFYQGAITPRSFEAFINFYKAAVANNVYTPQGVTSFKSRARDISEVFPGKERHSIQAKGRRAR